MKISKNKEVMSTHKTEKLISPEGETVFIDCKIAELIKHAWRLGFTTTCSCENFQDGGKYAQISIKHLTPELFYLAATKEVTNLIWLRFEDQKDYDQRMAEQAKGGTAHGDPIGSHGWKVWRNEESAFHFFMPIRQIKKITKRLRKIK